MQYQVQRSILLPLLTLQEEPFKTHTYIYTHTHTHIGLKRLPLYSAIVCLSLSPLSLLTLVLEQEGCSAGRLRCGMSVSTYTNFQLFACKITQQQPKHNHKHNHKHKHKHTPVYLQLQLLVACQAIIKANYVNFSFERGLAV